MKAKCEVGSEIVFPAVSDHRGDLNFIEGGEHIPFDIARVYYLHSLPPEAERGGHAHKDLEQVMIAIHGSFDLVLDDGGQRKTINLNNPNVGLYINGQIWREMKNFSSDCVCLVLASKKYDEDDYIRDYTEFSKTVRGANE